MSDAENGVDKYGAKAAAQHTSIVSKIVILERELDREDTTHQDILDLRQRMSAIENLLDGNLTDCLISSTILATLVISVRCQTII